MGGVSCRFPRHGLGKKGKRRERTLYSERYRDFAHSGRPVEAAQQTYPNAKWMQWDAMNRDSAYTASKAAFGGYYDAQYRLEGADVIVSLDADFLSGITHPGFLRLAGDYANRRKLLSTAANPIRN